MPKKTVGFVGSLIVLVFVAVAAHLAAQMPTTRIAIEGGSLVTPIEVTDLALVNQFKVWDGLGTFSRSPQTGPRAGTEGFMIDWPSGPVTDRPVGLPRYKVSFYAISPDRGNAARPAGVEFLAYTVFYEYDAASGRGFVYLPGKNDPEWTNNVFSIVRGVEGNWLRATGAWDRAVGPLLRQ